MADINITVTGPENPEKAIEILTSEKDAVLSAVDEEKNIALTFQEEELTRAVTNLATTTASFAEYIGIKSAALAGCTVASAGEQAAGVEILDATGAIGSVVFVGDEAVPGNELVAATEFLGFATDQLDVATNFHTLTQISEFSSEIFFLWTSLAAMAAMILLFIEKIAEKIKKIENAAEYGSDEINSIMGGTIARLASTVQNLQNKTLQIQRAIGTNNIVPINKTLSTLGVNATGGIIPTNTTLFNVASISAIPIAEGTISPTQLIRPNFSNLTQTTPLNTNIAQLSSTGVLTIDSTQLSIPDGTTLGIMSSSLKICK